MLVLDISMPGRSGMDVLRDVKHAYPRLPVIILSLPAGGPICRALFAGRCGGVHNKESAPEELAEATKKILSGVAMSARVSQRHCSQIWMIPSTSPCMSCFRIGNTKS